MIYRLKELRLEKKITQKDFANKLNITQQTYSDYETGKTDPDIETLILIGDILETRIDYLLGRADDFGNISIQTSTPALSSTEEKLIADFRALPRPEQAQASEYVHFLAQRRGTKKQNA